MRLGGVSYDEGWALGVDWRPLFDSDVARETDSDLAVLFDGEANG